MAYTAKDAFLRCALAVAKSKAFSSLPYHCFKQESSWTKLNL